MQINKITDSQRKDSRIRLITSFGLLAVVFPAGLFGNYAFLALIVFLSFFATKELLEVPGKLKYNISVKIVVFIFVFSFIFWTFIKSSLQGSSVLIGSNITLPQVFISLLAIMLYALTLFFIGICDRKFQLADITYLFTMGLILALGFQGLLYLRLFPNGLGLNFNIDKRVRLSIVSSAYSTYGTYFSDYYTKVVGTHQDLASCILFAYTLIGVWLSDVGAYVTGMFFGKHRMNPRISPHKTWEGFFGGILFSVVFSLGFALLMEFVFKLPLIPGILQFSYSPLLASLNVAKGHGWVFIVALSLIMPTISALGGLLFSLIKRTYGIKDFGKIFPGHGGVIDRFDSVLISSIAMAILIQFTVSGWSFLL